MGIGVLMAFSPFVGTQTWAALILAFLFRANRLSTLAGTFVANPLTMPIFYFSEVAIGTKILGISLSIPRGGWKSLEELLSLGGDILLAALVGFVILGAVASLVSFFVTYRAALVVKKIRHKEGDTP
jgi:uncharacterized protein (DUF2062 family)